MPSPLRRQAMLTCALVAFPATASACILDWSHSFNPFPPCVADADKLAKRLDERNIQILADVAITIQMVNSVKQEVRLWQTAIDEVGQVEARLKRVFGDLTVSPIASLASAYQRSALSNYVSINERGQVHLSNRLVEAVERAKDRVGSFSRGNTVSAVLGGVLLEGQRDANSALIQQLKTADNWLKSATDWRKQTDALTDSLFVEANRRATRYAAAQAPEGYTEALISSAEVLLTGIRSSILTSQAQSTTAGQVALEYIGRAEEASRAAEALVKKGP